MNTETAILPMDWVRDEFPDYDDDLTPFANDTGWMVNAWHNDSMPYLQHSHDVNDQYRLWIDYRDPSLREEPTSKRFNLSETIWDGSHCEYFDRLSTDSWEEMLRALSTIDPETNP
jgi:hypothetical protein